MSNANRDYAIVYDVKNGSLVLSRPLKFYITDKNTSNIFVRLVTRVSVGNGIDQYTDIEQASDYILTMRVIKPNNEVKSIEATQHEPESIFQFDLTEDFKDIPGKYICELTISTIVSKRQELITSDPFNYEVKRSILSNISEIIETEDITVEKLLNDLEATKAEISSQVKETATKAEVDVERKRIDAFISLPEGSTTGDAELIDARIGANGVTYNNLGTAIRKQINAITSDVSSSSTLTINDSFTQGVISVDISGFKGQVVEFIISCDNSILADNFGIQIGITKPDGTDINAICTITPNKTFRLKLDYNIIKINAWIASKLGNGDVVLTASIKNIFDYAYELDNKISKPNHLQGLSFSILGDSYSTYKGWIPSGNASWYSDTGNSTPENDVAGVADTWWYKLSKDSGMSLLVNDSYSGSTVSTTGYNGDDYTSFCFTTRMVNTLGEKRALEPKPNIIFIFGGTNDNAANSPIGELKYSDWSSNDLKSFLPAFCYMIAYIKKYNPQARIINIINTDLKSEITNGMVSACEYYGIENIALSDIGKTGWHPNKEGMEAIKNQIISIL